MCRTRCRWPMTSRPTCPTLKRCGRRTCTISSDRNFDRKLTNKKIDIEKFASTRDSARINPVDAHVAYAYQCNARFACFHSGWKLRRDCRHAVSLSRCSSRTSRHKASCSCPLGQSQRRLTSCGMSSSRKDRRKSA